MSRPKKFPDRKPDISFVFRHADPSTRERVHRSLPVKRNKVGAYLVFTNEDHGSVPISVRTGKIMDNLEDDWKKCVSKDIDGIDVARVRVWYEESAEKQRILYKRLTSKGMPILNKVESSDKKIRNSTDEKVVSTNAIALRVLVNRLSREYGKAPFPLSKATVAAQCACSVNAAALIINAMVTEGVITEIEAPKWPFAGKYRACPRKP